METIEFPNLFSGEIQIDRAAFSVFGFNIYWYAIIIAAGIFLAVLYCSKRGKKYGVTGDEVFDVALYGGIAGFVGARAYYCIFWNLNPANEEKFTFWSALTEIHKGGLAIYGGIIAGVIVGVLVCKVKKAPILPMMDVGGTGFLIGQAIGRWGNFVNQEAFGAPTAGDLPWGMTGSVIARYPEVIAAQEELGTSGYALVHPCFLYESLWCGLGIILIHFVLSRIQTFDGELFLYYVIWYGAGRGLIEGLRTDSLYIGPLRVSQLLGFASAAFCLILLFYFKGKVKKDAGYQLQRDTEERKRRIAEYELNIKLEKETQKAYKALKKAGKAEEIAPSIFGDEERNKKD
ncbi:MAG: prolipoprotein diacylglyceryl transferase [Bacteroides sp.]|nr:prolipoprotein diacylglyceryl transferase [Roseburia sp.]MCM1461628.1 prolipoprotein diacylglyceryl transferase [Bacteroides sp.]